MILFFILLVTGAYLYALPGSTPLFELLFVGGVLLHAGAGLVAVWWLIRFFLRRWRASSTFARTGWLLITAGAALGGALMFTGTTRPYQSLLLIHIGASLAGLVIVSADALAGVNARPTRVLARLAVMVVVAGLASAGAASFRENWQGFVITNPELPPASMLAEGDGPDGPFFPSSSVTSTDGLVPVDFFMESEKCQRCHEDAYEQWFSSAHHFSSFNNQWYRKSIEYMQDVIGPEPSKWCGGCHDPALLFTGMMDKPIRELIDEPEAQVGLGCVMCHSITVNSTMGQGGYTIEYPPLYQLFTSENPFVEAFYDLIIHLNPETHRRAFLKPALKDQSSEFCSSCHKVHLDVPVNDYRWIRGFNDYDNWQASGVSGQGSRSFYYPPAPQTCTDCHMPVVESDDLGNENGFVHSHRFPAANTALPTANNDQAQLDATIDFLQNDIVSIDIFAISAADPAQERVGGLRTGELSTTFAVGEEADVGGPVFLLDTAPLSAPIDRVNPMVRRGDSVRIDVVVRTRKVGHFFPAGTVDAFDVWVELIATDDNGQTLFWSGMTEDDGRGPVEPGAHFYRSLLIDEHGNAIDKRNAWAARAVVYTRLIPPGSADTIHYRLEVPEDAGDEINIESRLHYRKFAWFNTQFAYAGVWEGAEADRAPGYDDGTWRLDGDTSNASGELKEIPDLPTVTLAEDRVTLQVVDADAPEPETVTVAEAQDWERWNDYGIGLFRQGDLRGAEAAFTRATEADPANVDGWVNIGRARVAEGDLEGAREVLERALAMDPDLARTNFFYSRILRAEGEFALALEHLETVIRQYPRDRVVWNDIGQIHFLERRYAEAVEALKRVLEIDPEDLDAHYDLALAYNGLNEQERALEHQALYLRFKADESAQALTGPYLQEHPEDNNERQSIHEHRSIDLSQVAQ
jgi:tetratricopeptide (TPR) repeat protein